MRISDWSSDVCSSDLLSFLGLLLRVLAPLAIVLATYNPTGYCFYTWFMDAMAAGELGGIHFLALAVLVICWSILLIATWNDIDTYGVILVFARLAAIIWVLNDWGMLRTDQGNTYTWIVRVCRAITRQEGAWWVRA